MRLTRLGSNPLQTSLIPSTHESEAIFGTHVDAVQAKAIAGSRAFVREIMQDGNWHTLPQLAAEIKRRFGVRCMETALSARVREMRGRGWNIECQRTKPGSSLYQYRASQTESGVSG